MIISPGSRTLQFFARDPFDHVRIALQRLDLVAELYVLGIQPIDILSHALDFTLRTPHGDESMRPKNVVHDQRQHEQDRG